MTEAYCPEEFADEVTPPPRESPDAWIVCKNGRFYIDASTLYSDEESTQKYELNPGAIIKFLRLEDFPRSRLTINSNGTWIVEPPEPAGFEHVMIEFDAESMDSRVEDLIKNYQPEPGQHSLAFYTWHEEVWTFDGGSFARGAA